MLSRWLCLVLIALHIERPIASVSFSIRVPGEKIHALPGESVTLPCSVAPTFHPDEVRWYRTDKYATPILLYKKPQRDMDVPTDPQYEGRASLIGTLENGVADLSIKNVTVADTGEYICYIQHDSWYEKGNVFIEVKVLGSSPLMSVAYEGSGQVNVTCISEGWSPQPKVTWTNQKGIEIKKGLHEMHSIDDQGLMTVGSWLLAPPLGSDGYICSVGLSDLEKTQSRLALNLSREKTSVDTQTGAGETVVIVILVLILLGVFAGLLYMYKKGLIKLPEKTDGRKADGKAVSDIEGKGEEEPLTSEHTPKDTEDAGEVKDLPPVKPTPEMVDKGTNPEPEMHVESTTMPEWDIVTKQQKQQKGILSLNPATAPPSLNVEKKKLKEVNCPHPEKIHGHDKAFPHVLSNEASESVYWEVAIKKSADKQSWYVGMCSDTRSPGIVPLTPKNGFWLLKYEKGTGLFLNTEPPHLVKSTIKPLEKLGVFLSQKGNGTTRMLSFYNADTEWPLCSFKHIEHKGKFLAVLSPGLRDKHPLTLC